MPRYFCFLQFFTWQKKRAKMETPDADWTPKKKKTFQASSSDLVSHKQVTRLLFLQTSFVWASQGKKKKERNFATTIAQSQPTASAGVSQALIAFSQYLLIALKRMFLVWSCKSHTWRGTWRSLPWALMRTLIDTDWLNVQHLIWFGAKWKHRSIASLISCSFMRTKRDGLFNLFWHTHKKISRWKSLTSD